MEQITFVNSAYGVCIGREYSLCKFHIWYVCVLGVVVDHIGILVKITGAGRIPSDRKGGKQNRKSAFSVSCFRACSSLF